MNIISKTIWLRCACLALILASSSNLPAQTGSAYAPPTAPASNSTLASMSEDIQMLSNKVSQLTLQIENLQQENENLRKQIITQADVNAAVQNAIAKSRDEMNKAATQANSDLRKEIVTEFTKQIEALARDTNAQLQTLAQAIGKPPPATTRVTAADPNQTPQNVGPGEVYIVKPGESLSKIAARFKVSVSEIEKLNNLTPADANKLREGQSLFIPLKNGSSATPASTN